MRELTDRQREILALVIELCAERRVAEILDMSYDRLRRHLANIAERLDLESCYVEFGGLAIEDHFACGGIKYQKVPHATDRFGRYNAQDGSGKRHLFRRTDIVERVS